MITPKEAEALATKHVQEYVNACGCNDLEDVGNALLKIVVWHFTEGTKP